MDIVVQLHHMPRTRQRSIVAIVTQDLDTTCFGSSKPKVLRNSVFGEYTDLAASAARLNSPNVSAKHRFGPFPLAKRKGSAYMHLTGMIPGHRVNSLVSAMRCSTRCYPVVVLEGEEWGEECRMCCRVARRGKVGTYTPYISYSHGVSCSPRRLKNVERSYTIAENTPKPVEHTR
jgi:hypothetical protein